jgi:hypothetical protein
MLKEFSTLNHSWAIKFRKFTKEDFEINFSAGHTLPLNEILVDWNEEK